MRALLDVNVLVALLDRQHIAHGRAHAWLATQVRSIADVTTAVARGALSRKITVDVKGEILVLKDTINTMVGNLRGTTEANKEQDWLKTNLAKFAGMLQGQRDLSTVGQMLLSELTPLVDARQGAIYQMETEDVAEPRLLLLATYAQRCGQPEFIRVGEGLVGQCALEKRRILLSDVPAASPTFWISRRSSRAR